MTGTVAMGLVVAAVAKATMMTLCQCTRVKCSAMQVAVAVAAVAAVDGVIGHGIGGKYIPIMARLAEARRWSKRRQTCLPSLDLTAIHNE